MKVKQAKQLRAKVENINTAGEIEKLIDYKTAYSHFRETALDMGDSLAMLYMGTQVTYKEMLHQIDIAAKGFTEIGIKYKDVVTLSLLPTPYALITFYALDKIGAVMHMVSGASGINELKRELKTIDSKYYVGNDILCSDDVQNALRENGIQKIVTISLTDMLPNGISFDKIQYIFIEQLKGIKKKKYDGENILTFQQILDIGRNSSKDIFPCKFQPDKMVTIAYTSGSTGESKAVVATWESLESLVEVMAMTEIDRFKCGDVLLSTFPLWIYYSLLNMLHEPLCLGVTVAFDPLFKPENIIRRNKQYRFNHWLTMPLYLQKMYELGKPMDCSQWRIIITGGDVLQDEIKLSTDKFIADNGGTAKVVQGYGASEVLGSFSYCYYENSTLGSVGKPCIGNMIKVIDMDTGKELGVNEIGIGYFYTPARMKEYYGNPQATAHNLVLDENGVVWYNTEDLVHYNERGELFLDGRLRRIAITVDKEGNPAKIIPERIKKEITNNGSVNKCEVITVPDTQRANVAIAFVVKSSDITKENLLAYCGTNLPDYMVPDDVIFVDDIPCTSNKKPDFAELERMYDKNKGV